MNINMHKYKPVLNICPECGDSEIKDNEIICEECVEYEKHHTSCCDAYVGSTDESDICPCCHDHSSTMWADRESNRFMTK